MRPVKPPDPDTKPPRFQVPPGACDTHLHVYGPFDRYPLAPERNYDPDPHSTLDDYLRVHRALGLERAVIVTGSGNGVNNQITLDALGRMRGRFKGVALLNPDISEPELLKLKEGGFTGFRIKANGRGGLSYTDTRQMIARAAGFHWHVEFMSESTTEVISALPFLSSLEVPFLFDHVAHAAPHQERRTQEFSQLLAILKNEEHVWINLYSFYQLSKAGPPDYADMIDVVQAIIAARPEHVVWGSNWPLAVCECPCPTMAICWTLYSRRLPMNKREDSSLRIIQPGFTGPRTILEPGVYENHRPDV